MNKKKINNFKYYDLTQNCNLTNKLLYKDLFGIKYPTIALIGASRSGKTELIRQILYHTCLPWETKIFILSSSVFSDRGYRKIINNMRDFNVLVLTEEPSDEFFYKVNKERNKKKNEYATENFVIFDDISNLLKNEKNINFLSTKNRHNKSAMLVSSQNYVDMNTKLRRQLTHLVLFGSLTGADLDKIHKDFLLAAFKIDLDRFIELYREITKEKYHFLVIDLIKNKFRDGMDTEIDH